MPILPLTQKLAIVKVPNKWSAYQIHSLILVCMIYFVILIPTSYKDLLLDQMSST
jgi:hypothetical protein